MQVPTPNPIAAELAAGAARYAAALPVHFTSIWRRLLEEAARPAPVVRLWNVYNEGYLLRGAGSDAPLLAIDLAFPKNVFGEQRDSLLSSLPALSALLVTHRHGDHADPDVIARVIAAGTPVYVCADTWEALKERLQRHDAPAGLHIVGAGDTLEAGATAVRVLPSDHRSAKVKESVAFAVTLDGLTILHAGDYRGFDTLADDWPRGADLAIFSVYHPPLGGRDDGSLDVPGIKGQVSDRAWLARIQWDQRPSLATLVERLAPRAVVLGHLYELGHEPEMLWRFLDTGLIREALFTRLPHTAVHALAPGECLPLLPR